MADLTFSLIYLEDLSIGTGTTAIDRSDGTTVDATKINLNNLSTTTSTFNTTGIVIDQAAADDEVITLQSSDVAHGITDFTDTDTYGTLLKASALSGGLHVRGFSEDETGAKISGYATTTDATTGTGSLAPILLDGALKSGTGVTAVASGANVAVMQNDSTTRWILKGNGDVWMDGDLTGVADITATGTISGTTASGFTTISGTTITASGVLSGNSITSTTTIAATTTVSGATVTSTGAVNGASCVLDQGAADGNIMTLESSDVAHGITDFADTDVYGAFRKINAASGGMRMRGFTESVVGYSATAFVTSEDTTSTTSSEAAVLMDGALKDGTGVQAMANGANVFGVTNDGTTGFLVKGNGDAWLNGEMTLHKVIVDQGADDDQVFEARSSDVAHGMTSLTDTSTFYEMQKQGATAGGVLLNGYSETNIGIQMAGRVTTEDTTKSTAALGPILMTAQLKSGTTVGAMSTANANLFVVRDSATAKFIGDLEGDLHVDGS